jgi:hypothetical protein
MRATGTTKFGSRDRIVRHHSPHLKAPYTPPRRRATLRRRIVSGLALYTECSHLQRGSRRRLKASVVSMVYVSAIGLLTKRDDLILLIVGLHHFGIITSPVQVRDSELRYHADPLVFIVHPVLHSRPNNIVIRQQLQKLRRTPHRHALMDDVRGERCPKRRRARCPPPQDANFSRKLQPQIVHTVHLFVPRRRSCQTGCVKPF